MNKVSPMACIIEKIVPGSRSLSIRWVDGHTSIFHYLWLADNSPQSLNGRGQRLHETTDLPLDIRPQALYHSSDNGLEISWEQLPQPSYFSTVWLRMHCYSAQPDIPQFSPWPGPIVSQADFDPEAREANLIPVEKMKCTTEESDLFQAMLAVRRKGIAVVQADANPPDAMDRLKRWAKDVDLSTNFSDSCECELQGFWEMRSWSPRWSGMHTENPDWKRVPAILWMSCSPSVPLSWELVLVDGFHLAEVLRVRHPEAFGLLSSIPVRFQGNLRQQEPSVLRSIIELDEEGAVIGVHFDQRSLAPFSISPGQMPAYYDAYRTFGRMIRDPMYQQRCRVSPGDLFIIDNRRMLHGMLPAMMNRHQAPEPDTTGIDYQEPCLLEV